MPDPEDKPSAHAPTRSSTPELVSDPALEPAEPAPAESSPTTPALGVGPAVGVSAPSGAASVRERAGRAGAVSIGGGVVAGGGVAVGERPGAGGGRPAVPAPWKPPLPVPLFSGWWPDPPDPGRRVVAGALLVGLLAAVTVGGFPQVGVNVLLVALAAAAVVARVPRRQAVSVPLVLIALGLAAVAAVRASGWLVTGCLLAAICLAGLAVLDLRRWDDLLYTVPLFGAALGRAVPWARRSGLLAGTGAAHATPWAAGLGISLVFTVIVGALLASADAEFADLVTGLFDSFSLGILPLRAFVLVVVAVFVLGMAFAVSSRPGHRSRDPQVRAAHPAEWLLPVLFVGATLATFLFVNGRQLFDGAELVGQEAGISHSERAVAGFWQLVAVTVIVIGLLGWAGARAAAGPPLHRRLMAAGGGALLLLALLLAASALRRVWIYQDQYGWTVTRLNGGVMELWLIVVLLGVGTTWALRRIAMLPRFVAGSAGLGLLVTALLGPDAVVAQANVSRWQETGKIDEYYVYRLSADAAGARAQLPGTLLPCAGFDLGTPPDPWYRWNLARSRATSLADRHC